jgi:hypothetical protein
MRSRSRTETARVARRTALGALIVCALAAAPADAASPNATPSPSADELWRSYPLQSSPEPTRAPGGTRPTATPVSARQADDDGGLSSVTLALQIAALLGAGLALSLWYRHHRTRPPAAAPEGPPAVPLAPPVPPPLPPPRPAFAPPDPHTAWTAEIAWTEDGTRARFRAIAHQGTEREVTLAESDPVQWPPTTPEAVAAVSAAAESLTERLTGAGWRTLALGDTWYARRFAWDPAGEPAVVPTTRMRRFRQQAEWPVEEYALWRCEVEPESDEPGARFQAVIYPPGRRGGRVSAAASEVPRLAAALRKAGWSPVGHGARWYSVRFVWRDESEPVTRLDLPTHETSEAP